MNSWSVCCVLRSRSRASTTWFLPVFSQRCNYANRDILTLRERGLWSDFFPREEANRLSNLLVGKTQTIYAGFDPTARSLHVGHLAVVSALLMCQRAGHRVVAVVGGATASVGDPSGRKSDRPELADEEIAFNATKIEAQLKRIFSNHEELLWPDDWKKRFPLQPAMVLNNLDWYRGLDLLSFLKQVGRKLRMNELLSRDSVKTRLAAGESGMSFLEFAYQALQSYDWVHLYNKYGCRIQIGGHDQMGNLVTGRELVSRLGRTKSEGNTDGSDDERVFALTVPLVTSETGDKFGKSAGNAVWLDAEMSSPFELYQFLYRAPDGDVPRLVKTLCPDSLKDLESTVLAEHEKDPGKRAAHKKLADTITLLCHGKEGLASAKRTTEALFSSSPAALGHLSAEELSSALRGATKVSLMLNPATTVLEMALRAKCFGREVDARRIIEAGGFYVNHRKTLFPDAVLIPGEHILPNGMTLARVGKKNHVLVQWLR